MVLKKHASTAKTKSYKILAGQDWRYYWLIVKKKVILGFLLIALIKIYFISRYGWLVAMDRSGGFDWLVAIFVFIVLGIALSGKVGFSNYRVAITGGVGGFFLGALTAILDLIFFRNLWALQNIILKPFLFIIIGMAVTSLVYTLVSNDIASNNKHKSTKN